MITLLAKSGKMMASLCRKKNNFMFGSCEDSNQNYFILNGFAL